MALSVENISLYFRMFGSWSGSIVLSTLDEAEEIPRKGQRFPWNGRTCLTVLRYVMKFLPNSDHHHHHHAIFTDTITRLDDLASRDRDLESEKEIVEIYVNSFIPEVQKFFRVPKLQELSDNEKSLKENEILAGFLDFLLQILDAEALIEDPDYEQLFAPLRKELRFVLTILGDIPFQSTQLQQVKNILAEFEILSNQTGTFIYSCFFATHPIKADWFYRGRDSLLGLFGLLNEKVKDHCIKFSEIPRDTTTQANAIDSLFIVESLLEDLENVINRRFDLPIDEVKDQIKTIHEEMMFSRTFLKDVEMAQSTYDEDEFKESFIQIRDVAYETEYLVNSYTTQNVPTWYLYLRLPTVIQNIRPIGIRLQQIKRIFDMKVLQVKKDSNKKLSFQAIETSVDVAEDDNVVIGFEDEKLKILDALTAGSKTRQTIYIFGMPGLGKTTMAKQLYDDGLCCDYFDKRAWSVVSQTYHKRDVLIDIFMSLATSKDKETISRMEDENLALEIHQSLMGKRYLIVLDDVWHSNLWYYLQTYFPNDANGSRIIVTSRIKDIAPTDSIFFPLPLLSGVQCWDLLENKVFSKEPCPQELLIIGNEIAAKCHGLPLATVVIAGVLKKLEKEERVWKKVESDLGLYMFDDPRGCSKILDLSYEYLPNNLKLCFLYLGIFPEDAKFQTRRLLQLWIAEGFIPKQEGRSPENVAEDYLIDLINRSLVMIVERKTDGRIKTCHIHDLLRDMCLRKNHEENFLKSIKEEFSVYEKHQRLAIHHTPNNVRSFGLHCRSFSGHLSDPSEGLSHMPLLRVIDLLSGIYSLSKEIYLLVNLRYLSASYLPHLVGDNLVNLEILCSFHDMELMLSSILKMVKLRHINAKGGCLRITKDCDTNQTTNLESLGDLSIKDHDDEEILRRSPFLRRLKCECKGTQFPNLHSLTQLESLSMNFLRGFKFKLTEVYFPSTIRKLSLYGIELPWEEMSIIGILPNLYFLRLVYDAFVGKLWATGDHAFVGEVWKTRDGEFQQLRFLTLGYLDLKQWITCCEHFPKLESLVLEGCEELPEIPNDLGNIPTLQTLALLSNCTYEACKSAVRIEKEQHELGNEELKVIIQDCEWSKDELLRECEKSDDSSEE